MGTFGKFDPDESVREGWARDSEDEVSFDGYNAFFQITTTDGTTGLSVTNAIGGTAFRAKSDGDGYVSKNFGVGVLNPTVKLDVDGTAKLLGLRIPTGAQTGYVLKSDSAGNATWGIPSQSSAQGRDVGFENRTDSEISFDDGTRTFSISPTESEFLYWVAGLPYYQYSQDSIIIDDIEGLHFVYYDGYDLLSTTTFSSDIILTYAFVAAIYWDADNSKNIYFADERHGVVMSAETHLHLHLTLGTQYISGLGISDITADGGGDSNAHAQLSVEDGVIRDEDLRFDITDDNPQNLSFPAEIPILYKYGVAGNWRIKDADTFPIIYYGTAGYSGTRLPYNEYTGSTWQLTEVKNNDFVLTHYFATNDINHPIMGFCGQAQYGDITSARIGASQEINDLVTSGLPLAEMVPIGTVIFQTSNNYTNTPKARIRATDNGDDYTDFRDFKYSSIGGPGSHSNLSNLAYDPSGHSGFQRKTFEASGDPTLNHDGYNSAGVGVNFEEGDFWININTEKIYVCKSNILNSANWDLILTPQEHRDLDQLIHSIAEDGYESITYDSGNKATNITSYSGSGTPKIREEQITYDSGNHITQMITIQYDSSESIVETMTETFTYDGGKVIKITKLIT